VKDYVIVVVNNPMQFDAILHSREFEFKRRPRCIVANGFRCADQLRGIENFTIIFGDKWSKLLPLGYEQLFMEVLQSRRDYEVLYSKW